MYSRTALEIRDHIMRGHYWYGIAICEKSNMFLEPVWEWVEWSFHIPSWLDRFYPGWKYVGCGSYRIALRNPAGDVVKVDLEAELEGNDCEISTYKYIISAYPEAVEQRIRPVQTWAEYVDNETVVFQAYIDTEQQWVEWDVDIDWIYELNDGLQGGYDSNGVAHIWDLQF